MSLIWFSESVICCYLHSCPLVQHSCLSFPRNLSDLRWFPLPGCFLWFGQCNIYSPESRWKIKQVFSKMFCVLQQSYLRRNHSCFFRIFSFQTERRETCGCLDPAQPSGPQPTMVWLTTRRLSSRVGSLRGMGLAATRSNLEGPRRGLGLLWLGLYPHPMQKSLWPGMKDFDRSNPGWLLSPEGFPFSPADVTQAMLIDPNALRSSRGEVKEEMTSPYKDWEGWINC